MANDTKPSSDLVNSAADRLAGFHHTISEQLNARLAESPRFFAVLVVVSTAYAYAVWNFEGKTKGPIFLVVSLLAYAAGLWSIWYLAALGYAFRFLQNTQHRIEEALGWDKYRPKQTGEPPTGVYTLPRLLWLLPGIYHAHFFGLCVYVGTVIGAFYWYWPNRFTVNCWTGGAAIIGIVMTFWVNSHYKLKFEKKQVRRSPENEGGDGESG